MSTHAYPVVQGRITRLDKHGNPLDGHVCAPAPATADDGPVHRWQDVTLTFTTTACPALPYGRRYMCQRDTHDRECAVPWGWDRDHTDQLVPYTVEQLAARDEMPHRYAYPDLGGYRLGHRLWLALRRDAQLTGAERLAKADTSMEKLISDLVRAGLPPEQVRSWAADFVR